MSRPCSVATRRAISFQGLAVGKDRTDLPANISVKIGTSVGGKKVAATGTAIFGASTDTICLNDLRWSCSTLISTNRRTTYRSPDPTLFGSAAA